MNKPMMVCGHVANAVDSKGSPCCVICIGIFPGAETVANTPDLTYRIAQCTCGAKVPSATNLAFFEFLGDGSPKALETCRKCHYSLWAHKPHNQIPFEGAPFANCTFEPNGGFTFDSYYCGCRGWD
jgi:hypothetical protein